MTALLKTPAAWPRILLPEPTAADPADLDAAVRAGAFEALKTAVRAMTPGQVVGVVAGSGLRGRGGAGYPTGAKWRTAAAAPGALKYVVANGYGADPAVQTDRTLLEAAPYAVVEGLALAAYAIGAREAFIAVRAEATEAIRRVEAALAAAEEAGFLGPDVLESGWDLTVTVRPVQGAYMLGEETVLLKALEGKRGQPEQRPPHPAERGLFGRPTVVDNVQTLASVPWIVRHGPEAYAAIGSKASPGTILVQLRGPAGAGMAEVPLGTPLRQLVALVSGRRGAKAEVERPLKAILVGGPSGGLLPAELLDTAYEFDALRAVDAHVGSGSIVVADDRACIVDLARLLTRFCADQACGKTIPCRIGTRRLSEVVDRIAIGTPMPTDAVLAADLASDIVGSGLCDHERLATLPMTTAMRYFRAELDDHLLRSTCPAGICHPIALAAAAGSHRGA
jgi:NADH:ubiquinone oxidoreductase subunit F (NADH-binding)